MRVRSLSIFKYKIIYKIAFNWLAACVWGFNRVIILFFVQGRLFHLNIRDGVLDLAKFINAAHDLYCLFHSVQFSHIVMSASLQPHGLQHARPPCPLPTPRVHSKSCPLSHWCHPTISSPVVHFSTCLQSFPASGSFQMTQFFTSGGQSIGVSASTSVLPINTQDWSPLGWIDWIALQSKGLSRVFSTPQF